MTLNCIKLTRLVVAAVKSVGYLNAPNVVNLNVSETKVPLKRFPRLVHLSMRKANQAVKISHPLKWVTLKNMKLSRVALMAKREDILDFGRTSSVHNLRPVLDRADGVHCLFVASGDESATFPEWWRHCTSPTSMPSGWKRVRVDVVALQFWRRWKDV